MCTIVLSLFFLAVCMSNYVILFLGTFFSKSNHFLLLQGVEEAGEGAVVVVGVSDQMVLCRLLPEC